MKQMELFPEPQDSIELLREEVEMLRKLITNISRSAHGGFDKHDKKMERVFENIALINKELGIKDDVFEIFPMGEIEEAG